MAVERLLYEITGANPIGIHYEGSRAIQTLRAEKGIRLTFTKGDTIFRENIAITSPVSGNALCREGWNTSIIFTETGNGFQVDEVHNVVNGQAHGAEAVLRHRTFSQIMTHGVDTCTVICIKAGREYLLAHFNKSEIGNFRTLLGQRRRAGKLPGIESIFCSRFSREASEEEIAAHNKVKESAEAGKYILFDRTNCPEEYYFSHMEFGVGKNNVGNTVYFGDICSRTPETYLPGEENPQTACCSLFEYNNMQDFSKLTKCAERVLNAETGNPASGGGGCVII